MTWHLRTRQYFMSQVLYSCSPHQVSKKLPTVYETVSCIQQLFARYALSTCYYARFVMTAAQRIQLCTMQATVSSTLTTGYDFLMTQGGEQEYSNSLTKQEQNPAHLTNSQCFLLTRKSMQIIQ